MSLNRTTEARLHKTLQRFDKLRTAIANVERSIDKTTKAHLSNMFPMKGPLFIGGGPSNDEIVSVPRRSRTKTKQKPKTPSFLPFVTMTKSGRISKKKTVTNYNNL
jgi:hypothetical protein